MWYYKSIKEGEEVTMALEDILILSVGERLRYERKRLNLGQDDLAGDKFSKNYISMFENNRRSINKRNAKYLAERINQFSIEKGIETKITPEYFLKSNEELAKERCEFKLKELEFKQLEDHKLQLEIHKVLKLSKKYDLTESLGEIYYLKGLHAYRGDKYRCAITNTQEALNHFNKVNLTDKSVKSYELLGDICFKKEYYEESIIYYNLGINMAKKLCNSLELSIHRKLIKSYDYHNLAKK